jgi:hypothetical protein
MVSHTRGLTTILPVSTRQGTSVGIWRNLQLNPETILGIFEKNVSTLFFTFFFMDVPKGLSTKYQRIYDTVNHTGGLTTILPVSTAARHLWLDLA